VAACLAVVPPAAAGAQQINGLAAWTIGSAASTYDDQSYQNSAFSQHYILGFDTPLIDGRLAKISTEGAFRTNAISSGAKRAQQEGDQRDIGYKIGAALFSERSFPLTVQVTKGVIDESGQYPSSSAIRGGLALAAGEIPPTFQTESQSMNAMWQLNAGQLPRVNLSYVTGRAETAGSGYHGAQRHQDVHVGVLKETARMRHSMQYERNAIDNLVLSAYNQRTKNLDYEFGALLTTRSRLSVHAGRRNMFSLFDQPSQIVDPAAGVYTLPSRGDISTQYAITSVSFDPSSRLSIDATGSLDRQEAVPAAVGARLVITSARLDVGGGLSVNASGTYGDRRQIIGDRAIKVTTRGGQTGATFRTGPRWLEGQLSYLRGMGSNRTPDDVSGETSMWSGLATVSSTIGWFTISAGRERSRAQDQILDFGNAEVLRDRASLQVQPGRLTLTGNWEDAVIERGRASTLATLWQRTGSASASYRLTRSATLTANAGAFTNIGSSGTDTTLFWGGTIDAEPVPALRLSAWVRHDEATATLVSLDQRGLAWLALAEYQIRDFTLGAEYRNTLQDLTSRPQDTRFEGRQMLIRISRKLYVPL